MRDQDLTSKEPADERREAAGQDVQSVARRRWLLRGGAIAPVVLTLTSRPVLGGMTPGVCIAPSVTMSAAASHTTQKEGDCSRTLSVNTWSTKPDWPGLGRSGSFHAIFAVGNRSGCRFFTTAATSLTLSEVMGLGSGSATADAAGNFDQDKVASSIITAYLNIASGTVDAKAMTLDRLQALWREWAINGNYTPYAGAKPWGSSDITAYLANNRIAPLA